MNEAAKLPEVMNENVVAAVIDLPVPVGWTILVKPYKAETMSAGGIAIPEASQEANRYLNTVGEVIAMGSLCYTDDRFRVGDRDPVAFCRVGDHVQYGQNVGHRFNVYDSKGELTEFILLNDDNVKTVVANPGAIRAYV